MKKIKQFWNPDHVKIQDLNYVNLFVAFVEFIKAKRFLDKIS